MPSRGLLLLAAVTLAAVIAAWVAIDRRYQASVAETQEGGLVFPALQSQVSAAVEIEVTRAGGRFLLSRRGGGWANMGLGGFPARPARVEAMIGALAGLRYIEAKTERATLHRKLGVEDLAPDANSTRVTLKDTAGAVLADLIVGRAKEKIAATGRPGLYLRRPGAARAWLAEGSLDLRDDAAGWSETSLVDVEPHALTALTLRHGDGEVVALRRNRSQDSKLSLQNLPAGAEVEHPYQIGYLAGLLQDLRFTDAKRAEEEDLPARPAFEARAETRDYLAVTLRAGEPKEDGSIWARIEAQVSDGARASDRTRQEAARIEGSFGGWSLQLPRRITDRLRIRLNDIVKTDAPKP